MKIFSLITKLLVILIFLFIKPVFPETIRVGLVTYPPLIIDENNGYVINLFKTIERKSNIDFDITIMNYVRAKDMLKNEQVDLIGFVPVDLETQYFYQYAQEINFRIPMITDLYSKNKNNFNKTNNLKIGIPRGNERFVSILLNIPIKNFYPGKLENLLRMLNKGRIDMFWFERASTMTTLKKFKIKHIYYQKAPIKSMYASFAVRNDNKGTKLKIKIDKLIKAVNYDTIFANYSKFIKMPEKGIIEY